MEQFTNDSKRKGIEDSFEIRVKKKSVDTAVDTNENAVQPITQEQKNKFKFSADKIKKTSTADLAQQLLKNLKL